MRYIHHSVWCIEFSINVNCWFYFSEIAKVLSEQIALDSNERDHEIDKLKHLINCGQINLSAVWSFEPLSFCTC